MLSNINLIYMNINSAENDAELEEVLFEDFPDQCTLLVMILTQLAWEDIVDIVNDFKSNLLKKKLSSSKEVIKRVNLIREEINGKIKSESVTSQGKCPKCNYYPTEPMHNFCANCGYKIR